MPADLSPITKLLIKILLVSGPISALTYLLASRSQNALPATARVEDSVETLTTLAFMLCAAMVILVSAIRYLKAPKSESSRPTLD